MILPVRLVLCFFLARDLLFYHQYPLCFVNKKLALDCVDVVCDEMSNLLSWDESMIKKEKFECKEFIKNNF